MKFTGQGYFRPILAFLILASSVTFGEYPLCSRTWAEGSGSTAASGIEKSASTGTIEGTVKSPWMRRLPGLVYVEKIEGLNCTPPEAHAVMDQKDLVFTPHVLPVIVGTMVDFPNSDAVRHSVFSTSKSSVVFNLGTYEAGVVKHVVLDKPGVTTLLCNVHTEMVAYVIVLETPFFAFTDSKGGFTLQGVPAGTHKITFWHEKLKPVTQEVTVKGGETTQVTFADLKGK